MLNVSKMLQMSFRRQ